MEASELRTAEDSLLLARYQLARQMGVSFQGARDTYTVLGYETDITTQQYRDLYDRGGIAGRCVDVLPKAVWRGDGEILEDEDPEVVTQFEQAFYDLNDRLKVWATLQRLHIQASLSTFAVLFIGAAGDWSMELPKAKSQNDLLYFKPYGGEGSASNQSRGQSGSTSSVMSASVLKWDEDAKSPRFGQPLSYAIRNTNFSNPELQRPVHWSRIVHAPAEGFLDDAVFGPPKLRGVWNYFADLLKLHGGGSEAYWLNAHPGMHMDIDKDMTFPGASSNEQALAQLAAMKASAEEYKHQLTRWIQTRGVKIKQLNAETADFSAGVDTLLKLIAGTIGIPQRLLTGSERGELASSQDRSNWDSIVGDCRSSYAHPIILRPFVDRLIAYGYLPKPATWSPVWPETDGMTQTEIFAAAETLVKLNDHGEKVITGAEVREFLGREPLDPEDTDVEDEQVAQLEAALRKGGKVDIVVRAAQEAAPAAAPSVMINHPPLTAQEPPVIIVNPTPVTIETYDKEIVYDAAGRATGIRRRKETVQ